MISLIKITNFIIFSLSLSVIFSCSGGGGGGEDTTTNSPTQNGSIKVTAITIYPQSASVIKEGEPLQLKATIDPANATNKAILWESSDSDTISVSETGLITANVESGSAIITATAQDGSEIKGSITATAIPNNQSIKVTAITISPQNAPVRAGESLQLKATIDPANATNKAILWSSSDTAKVSVSDTGLVTANVDAGSACAAPKVSNRMMWSSGLQS